MNEQPVQAGGLHVDVNRLFDTVNNIADMGRGLGNAWANVMGENQQQSQQRYDPNSRINNNNPYGNPYDQNPYSNIPTQQTSNYGYAYGNVDFESYDPRYQNGYPGISNPSYGM
jgi:hypothetical protein